jgi:pyridoxine 5-phosphate synthase
MAVRTELDRVARRFDRHHFARDARAARIVDRVAIASDVGDVAFLEIDDAPGDRRQRARVRGEEMIALACALKPEMAMLVPEGREEVTTEGGLDVASQEARLKTAVARLADAGIITSVFIDADVRQVEAAARIGARVCEIHTGPYAHAFHAKGRDPQSAAVIAELSKVREAGSAIRALGMRFNAGHALNYFNVQSIAALPGVRELHIGHAIVSRAVFVGLREAVRQMKTLIREAAAG